MNQLKVGDVVYLNSEKNVPMTVASVDNGEIQCIYFSKTEQKFVQTMAIPEEALVLITKPNDDYYR